MCRATCGNGDQSRGRANTQATTQLLGTRISLHSYYNAVLVAGGAAQVCKAQCCLNFVVTGSWQPPISSPSIQARKRDGANDWGVSMIMQVFDSPDKCRNIAGELGIAAARCAGQWKRQIKASHRNWFGSFPKPAGEYF